jgi:hypothetical protein
MAGEIISERRATSNRNAERHHRGFASDFPRNPHTAPLKRIIAAMARDALVAQAEIARLSFPSAGYRRVEFGCSSEKLTREVEQLELVLETVEADQAERLAAASPTVAAAGVEGLVDGNSVRSQLYAFVRSICCRARKTILSPALISPDTVHRRKATLSGSMRTVLQNVSSPNWCCSA